MATDCLCGEHVDNRLPAGCRVSGYHRLGRVVGSSQGLTTPDHLAVSRATTLLDPVSHEDKERKSVGS